MFIHHICFLSLFCKYKLIHYLLGSFAASLRRDYSFDAFLKYLCQIFFLRKRKWKVNLPNISGAKVIHFSFQGKENSVACLVSLMGLYICILLKEKETIQNTFHSQSTSLEEEGVWMEFRKFGGVVKADMETGQQIENAVLFPGSIFTAHVIPSWSCNKGVY